MSASLQATTEIIKNLVETVAVIGGGAAIIGWLYTRKDRAASVLLELEERFNNPTILNARGMLEDEAMYKPLDSAIQANLSGRETDNETGARLDDLDTLLRFYVLLRSIRQAKQVPDESLRLCYAYWLNFYHHPARKGFHDYVDTYFKGLSGWLADDAQCASRRRFFRPDWPFGRDVSSSDGVIGS